MDHRSMAGTAGPTNAMVRLIPAFRERDRRPLVCATNSTRARDTAFLRGRFDYLVPVGPPGPGGARGDVVAASRYPSR